jgi:hypothetical protein
MLEIILSPLIILALFDFIARRELISLLVLMGLLVLFFS